MFFLEVFYQLKEGEALGFGAGVGGVAVGIEATDIGDAYAVCIMAGAVGTDLFDRTASVDAAIGEDDIVIAYVAPAEAFVVTADALDGAVGIGTGGGAVDDDFGDLSHFHMGLMGDWGLKVCNDIATYATKGSKPTARGAVGLLGSGFRRR